MIPVIPTGFGEGTNETQQPASYSCFGTPPRAYQRATGENQLFAQSVPHADGSPENIWVDSELHTTEYLVKFHCLDFTYEYSCLSLTDFFFSFFNQVYWQRYSMGSLSCGS